MKSDYPSTFDGLYEIIQYLRSPDGCPWDRKQTPDTLKSNFIEEVFECIDAIEKKDSEHVKEELGDVMLLVCLIASIYEERGDFNCGDIFKEINEKMIRRHPHVFSESKVTDSDAVIKQWDQIKADVEGREKPEGTLSNVPKNIPPLERSFHLQKKAAKKGFNWDNTAQVLEKLNEEIEELNVELNATEPLQSALEEEIGDILFTVVNLSRFLKFDPTLALHKANKKFVNRFSHIESRMKELKIPLSGDQITKMEEFWQEAKKLGK